MWARKTESYTWTNCLLVNFPNNTHTNRQTKLSFLVFTGSVWLFLSFDKIPPEIFFSSSGKEQQQREKKRTNLSFHCNWKFPCQCYFHNKWNIKNMYNKRQSMTACAYCCSSKKAMWCKMQRVNKTAHVEANLVTKGGLVYNRVCTPVNWKTVQ